MLVEKLVSVITPCFNGELYISRFLDSILEQTYSNIELILIDDGSTDNTKGIIEDYQQKFIDRGFSVVYIYQKNQGQAAAVNRGLKLFKGEYLTWPDSDDFLSGNSIELRVKFLEENSKFDFVRSDAAFYQECDIEKQVSLATKNIKDKYREKLFDAFIQEKDIYLCNGCYMVKTKAFLHVNPQRSIYESRAGQNWQMLLPISNTFLCGFIEQPLYHIVLRLESHSREIKGFDKEISRCDEHLDILLNVLSSLDVDQNKYTKLLLDKYSKKKLIISCRYGKVKKANIFYKAIEHKSISDFYALITVRTFCYSYAIKLPNLIKYIVSYIRK